MASVLLACSATCVSISAISDTVTKRDHCQFVQWWAQKATYIVAVTQLPETSWHILEDGYPPSIYQEITEIKREAYHDLDALRQRIDAACAK